jgi:3'(2'), 5'-bisphosphate nucleotidase
VSRFHNHPDVELFALANAVTIQVPLGSALKYGRLALGEVDVFPRLVGSAEWDTAAGQAVLEAAGGAVLDWQTGQPMRYGKTNRRNGRLMALRAPYRYAEFNLKEYGPELV